MEFNNKWSEEEEEGKKGHFFFPSPLFHAHVPSSSELFGFALRSGGEAKNAGGRFKRREREGEREGGCLLSGRGMMVTQALGEISKAVKLAAHAAHAHMPKKHWQREHSGAYDGNTHYIICTGADAYR